VVDRVNEFEAEKPRKRRWIRILLSALILIGFGGGAAASVWILRRAPELTADAISSTLGRKVEMGKIEVRLGLRVQVEVQELRVYEGAVAEGDPMLEVPIARGYQSWPRMLLGQFVPQQWVFESPVARLRLEESGPDAKTPNFPLQSLEVKGGSVDIDAGARGRLKLDQMSLVLERPPLLSALLSGVRGSFSGRVSNPAGVLGRTELEFSMTDEDYEVSGRVDGVRLGRLSSMLGIESSISRLRGVASGTLRVRQDSGDVRVKLDMALRQLQAQIVGIEDPLITPIARIAGELEYVGGRWRIEPDSVRFGDFAVRGRVTVDPRTNGHVVADLEVDDFSAKQGAAKQVNLISLLGLRLATWKWLDERLLAGEFSEVAMHLDLPSEGFWGWFAFPRPLGEDEFRFVATVRDGVLAPNPASDPLENLSGSFALAGDSFRISQLHVARAERSYPQLDLEIVGFSDYIKLPREERAVPSGPGVGTPGLEPALAALSARRTREEGQVEDPDAAPREPLVIDFENLWVGYPGLLFQIRNAKGRMRFPPRGPEISKARAVVSGGLADLDIRWDRVDDAIQVRIEYLPGEVPPYRIPDGVWLSGDLSIPELVLGPWQLERVRTALHGEKGRIDFERLDADISNGTLDGTGDLDLTQQASAPLRFQLSLRQADAARVTEFMRSERAAITGVASAEVRLDGSLDPTREFMDECDMDVDFEFKDGSVLDLPIAIQLARLPSLEGVRGLFGQALPYETMSGQVLLRKGLLQLEDFSILGPQLRALAAGRIDLRTETLESDLLVALLFLQTLDRVIGKVPLVGQMLLGSDGSLVSLGFRVRGAFGNPSVTPATPSSLQNAADWTGGWLRRVGEMIPGLRSGETTEETPGAPEIKQLEPLSPRDSSDSSGE